MPPGTQRRPRKSLHLWLTVTFTLGLLVSSCITESARQTATIEAGGTPEATITPAGNRLVIEDEPVIQAFVPDPEQAALYALTAQRLYVWRNREWVSTPTENDGRMLLVDQNEPERLYRGNHPSCGQEEETTTFDFEVSEDAGETWRVVPNGQNVRPLAVDPVFPDVVYGSDCALRISSDRGETWSYIQPLVQHEIVDLVVVGERLLVLGVSTQGQSLVRELRLTSPEDLEISDILTQVSGIATVDADEDRIAVGGPDGVRISLDGGQTWAMSRVGMESVTIVEDEAVTPDPSVDRQNRRFGVLTVEIDPTHNQRIFAGTVRGLYISQDDGATWDLYGEIDNTARVTDIQFAAGGADIYVTTDSGVVTVPNP